MVWTSPLTQVQDTFGNELLSGCRFPDDYHSARYPLQDPASPMVIPFPRTLLDSGTSFPPYSA